MNKIDNALYFSNNYDRRQIKTKKAIIAAFITLLQQKNISKITITELSKLADIDRKTLFKIAYNELMSKTPLIQKVFSW